MIVICGLRKKIIKVCVDWSDLRQLILRLLVIRFSGCSIINKTYELYLMWQVTQQEIWAVGVSLKDDGSDDGPERK